MKKLLFAVLVWTTAIHGAFAQSPQQSATFNVAITLNSGCTLSSITDVQFTYTAFAAATNATGGSGAFSVTCTSGFGYGLGLQSGTAVPTTTGAASIGPILDNVVNLNYTLSLATTSSSGTGSAQSFNIGGQILANQAGTCGSATCTNGTATNRTHTLIVSY